MKVARAWRVVLLGLPGVGKGVQAELLSHALGACPLSTGELVREACAHCGRPGTALATARAHMTRGELVPDHVVLAMIRERRSCLRCGAGFLLDGFPRTLSQVRALDALLAVEGLRLDAVLHYHASHERLRQRLAGRRVCSQCHAVYHIDSQPPKAPGVCDRCGEVLVQRPDDFPDAIAVRLQTYASATEPLVDHYRQTGLLISIRAEGSPADILAHTLDALIAHEQCTAHYDGAETHRAAGHRENRHWVGAKDGS